jgi:hypothetical protein
MTIASVAKKKSFGKSSGIESAYIVNNCWKASRPVIIFILVFIEKASAVNNLAFCGRFKFYRSFIN